VTTRRQSRSIFYAIADDKTRAILAMLYEIFCGDPAPFLAQKRPAAEAGKPVKGDVASFAIVARQGTR
jgi:hypothetical protein